MNRWITAAGLLVCFIATSLLAGTLSFTGRSDKDRAIYQPGETMVFTIQLLEDGQPVAGKNLKWTRRGDDQKTETGQMVSSINEPLVVRTSIQTPGFVYLMVEAIGDDQQPLKNNDNKPVRYEGGGGVELEKLAGYAEPADFDAFWQHQKERLAAIAVKANLVEVESKNPAFVVYDVKIDCAGDKPVSGYLTMPREAQPKTLVAQVGYMGYGVTSASPNYQPGKIVLNINAHGIENGKDASYYEHVKSQLKTYAFDPKENLDAETAYFNGMMLRVLRSLDYIKTRPEWNGKELIVEGGSQGGLQALTAAGLDRDVTQCLAWKPWCCDLAAGAKMNRLKGWRPDWTDALGYYDPVNHAKRIKCQTNIVAGLGDYVCPPSGITVLYNNLKSPKRIEYIQGSNHGFNPPDAQKFVLESK